MQPKVQTVGKYSFVMDKDNTIGQGGFGIVYKCISDSQPSGICIKVYNVDPNNHWLQKQLDQEQDVIEKLENASHQNLIKIHYYGYYNNGQNYCIVMDLCSLDLYKYCEKRNHLQNPFNENEILSFIKQIANGYKSFLTRDIIHRDIKPSNILVNIHTLNNVDTLYYQLADFDCSKIKSNNFFKTVNKGTWQYCAPESDKDMPQTQQADVFSFGCTLYYFVYGYHFKIKKSDFQVGRTLHSDYIENNFDKLERLSPTFEAFIIDLLKKCLLRDKDKRITWLEIIQLKQIQQYQIKYTALDSLYLEITQSLKQLEKQQIKDRSKRISKFFKLLRYKIYILDETINLIKKFHSCHPTEIFIISLTKLIIHYYNFQLGLISEKQDLFPKFLIQNKKYNFPKEDIILYTTEVMEKKNLLQGKEALEASIIQLNELIQDFENKNKDRIDKLKASLSKMEDIILSIQFKNQLEKCELEDAIFLNIIHFYNQCFQKVLSDESVLNKNDQQKQIQEHIIINIQQIFQFETTYDQSKYKEIKIPSSSYNKTKKQIQTQ